MFKTTGFTRGYSHKTPIGVVFFVPSFVFICVTSEYKRELLKHYTQCSNELVSNLCFEKIREKEKKRK